MSDCCQHTPTVPANFGVENPRSLDAMALDKEKDEVVLIMVEPRPWDGSEGRLLQLQEKLNAYLSFVLDGEFTENFPDLKDKPVRLQLDCAMPPDAVTNELLKMAREQISFQGIGLEVRMVGEPMPEGEGGCGSGCGCH